METKEKSPKERKPRAKKSPKETQAVAVVRESASLSLANPSDVMEFGKTLKKYIEENSLSVSIQGSNYAMVDGWKFAGLNFGLTAIPRKPVKVHEKGQYITILYVMKDFSKNGKSWSKEVPVFIGFSEDHDTIEKVKKENKITNEITKPYFAYECECDIVKLSDGTHVGYGQGFCSNLESLKSGFDEYSVNSMAQTRSIGKAYRNLIGFVMKSAGFEPTPGEEMEQVKENERQKEVKEPKLPNPTQGQYKGIMEKVNKGEINLEEVEKHFTLTEEQRKALEIIEQSKKKP